VLARPGSGFTSPITHLLEGRADNLTEHNQTLGSGRIALNSAS
jgi:hypothetical protein